MYLVVKIQKMKEIKVLVQYVIWKCNTMNIWIINIICKKKISIIFFFVDIEISKTYNSDWRLAFKEHPASENLSLFTNCCKSNKSSIYFIAIERQMFF
jgi:hypothetical protein